MDQRLLQRIAPAMLVLPMSSVASAQIDSQDPQSQLDQLREQLDFVESVNAEVRLELDTARVELGDNWLNEQRVGQVAAIVQSVLDDSDSRSNLSGDGLMMGWSNGFFLASADGQYKLKISGLMQTRFLAGWVGKQSLVTTPTIEPDPNYKRWKSGFEATRTRLNIAGSIGDPHIDFLLQLGFGREDEDNNSFADSSQIRFAMREWDAWVRTRLSDDISLKAGIFKLPFTRESLVPAQNQLVLERSSVDHRLGLGRSQGVELAWASRDHRYFLAYSNGSAALFHGLIWNQLTTPPPWSALNRDTSYAVTMRYEWKLLGNWKQFQQFTSPPGSERGVLIGIAGHRQVTEEDPTSALGEDSTFWGITGDVSLQFDGATLFGSILYERLKGLVPSTPKMDIVGFVAQASTYITNQTEAYVRWETGQPDGPSSSATDMQLVTVGFNHYIDGQDIKISADIGFDFGELTQFMANDQTGWQYDSHRRDQAVFRSQLQVSF
ncbi:hypothetical protein H8D29_00740 [PVC group bacterium]|nr:hypothetical protein [PVC group bacterium]